MRPGIDAVLDDGLHPVQHHHFDAAGFKHLVQQFQLLVGGGIFTLGGQRFGQLLALRQLSRVGGNPGIELRGQFAQIGAQFGLPLFDVGLVQLLQRQHTRNQAFAFLREEFQGLNLILHALQADA